MSAHERHSTAEMKYANKESTDNEKGAHAKLKDDVHVIRHGPRTGQPESMMATSLSSGCGEAAVALWSCNVN